MLIIRALLLFTLLAPMHAAIAADKLTVILDWFVDANHAALFAAHYCDAYKSAGLDVTFIAPADPNAPPRLVAAGQADLAVSYQGQLGLLDDHGFDLMRVATLVPQPLNTLMTLGDSGIHSIADLKGRRIGVSIGGIEEALLGTMLATAHLTLADVIVTQVNFEMLPALRAHRLDAAMGAFRNDELLQAQQAGLHPLAFLPERNGVPPYDELILVARRTRAADPRITRFVAALRQGAACLKSQPDAMWRAFAAEHPDQDTPLGRVSWAATLPLLAADPAALDADRYRNFESFLASAHLINKALPVGEIAK